MIGVFDSGSGGLTVLKEVRAKMPRADIMYFGDIKHAPYGSRTPKELAQLVEAGMYLLIERGAKELISACNTVSASVLQGLTGRERVIEMTRPAARYARRFAGKRMLVLATEATVRSQMYQDVLKMIVDLDALAVPELAGAIERDDSLDVVRGIVRDALESKSDASYDLVLLGCTHYPLVRKVIQDEASHLWPRVELFDPAVAVAEEAHQRFSHAGRGETSFFISQDSPVFRARVAELFPHEGVSIEVI